MSLCFDFVDQEDTNKWNFKAIFWSLQVIIWTSSFLVVLWEFPLFNKRYWALPRKTCRLFFCSNWAPRQYSLLERANHSRPAQWSFLMTIAPPESMKNDQKSRCYISSRESVDFRLTKLYWADNINKEMHIFVRRFIPTFL